MKIGWLFLFLLGMASAQASLRGHDSRLGSIRGGGTYFDQLPMEPFASAGDDLAWESATDASGNVFVVGITFGSFSGFTNLGSYDCFVAKYNTSGTFQWVQQFGTASFDVCSSIAVDSLGNIYVAGGTYGAFSGFTNAGGMDAVLLRLTSTGTLSWAQQFGTNLDDAANKLTIDSSRRPLVAGITLGSLPGFTNAGGQDTFIARYATNGTQNWIQQLGTAGNEQVFGMAIDSSNRSFIAGYTTGAFAGATNAGKADAFVSRYSNTGAQSWVKQFGTSENDVAFDLAVILASGITNVVGYTDGTFAGNTSAGGEDIFFARYALAGTQTWVKQTGTSGDDEGLGAWNDTSGNTYIAGFTTGTLAGNTSAGGDDAFLMKYSNTGTLTFAKQFGTAGNDWASEICGDGTGITYVPGSTDASFPGFSDLNGTDVFVAKYSNAGAQTWVRQTGTN